MLKLGHMLAPYKPHGGITPTLVLVTNGLFTLHGTSTEEQGKTFVQQPTQFHCRFSSTSTPPVGRQPTQYHCRFSSTSTLPAGSPPNSTVGSHLRPHPRQAAHPIPLSVLIYVHTPGRTPTQFHCQFSSTSTPPAGRPPNSIVSSHLRPHPRQETHPIPLSGLIYVHTPGRTPTQFHCQFSSTSTPPAGRPPNSIVSSHLRPHPRQDAHPMPLYVRN